MKPAVAVFALSAALGLSAAAQLAPLQDGGRVMQDVPALFPADAKVDQFALTADGQRTYFVNASGEIWLYKQAGKMATRVTAGPAWDLNVSSAGNVLAYTKGGAQRGEQYVWVLALNTATGLAEGAERQIDRQMANAPSLSSDGQLVAYARDDASGVGQSVVIASLAGGDERVVAPGMPSTVQNIRWTPDAKTIYFGVDPPVACVPEWSCLPLAEALRQPPSTIKRVAATGGQVTTVATARGVRPGLSPDGTTLMYLGTSGARHFIVANPDGTPRETVSVTSAHDPIGWLRGSSVLLQSPTRLRALRAMSLDDGKVTTLMEGVPGELTGPAWSADGRLMMVVAHTSAGTELRTVSADGKSRRAIPLPDTWINGAVLAPDASRVAYLGVANNKPPIYVGVVELASGRSRRLLDIGQGNTASIRWLANSRALVTTETFTKENTRHAIVRRLDPAGESIELRDFQIGPQPAAVFAVDETTAILMDNAADGYRAVPLNGAGTGRLLLPAHDSDRFSTVSSDGKWLSVQVRPSNPASAPGQGSAIELVRTDGSVRYSIPIPFLSGLADSPKVAAGGQWLVILEAATTDPGVYLVSATGAQAARRILTYQRGFPGPELALSPDGRRLAYLITDNVPTAFASMDVSTRRPRQK